MTPEYEDNVPSRMGVRILMSPGDCPTLPSFQELPAPGELLIVLVFRSLAGGPLELLIVLVFRSPARGIHSSSKSSFVRSQAGERLERGWSVLWLSYGRLLRRKVIPFKRAARRSRSREARLDPGIISSTRAA